MAVRGDAEADEDSVAGSPLAGKAIGRLAGEALERGVDSGSPDGAAVLGRILAEIGEPADRLALAERLAAFTDRRVGRYWALIGVINGWPPAPEVIPAWEWFTAALIADPAPRVS
jgi:hypothetical protein